MSVKALSFLPEASLLFGRVHDVTGPAARTFAAITAGLITDADDRTSVLWIRSARARERLNPQGLKLFFDPSRIILAECERPLDILWSMEEGLRNGGAGLVIAELDKPADLKISRRLQLAAEAGGALGLCLFEGAPVANAAQTRWHASPCAPENPVNAQTDSTLWRLTLKKNKKGTLGAWDIAWDEQAGRIIVVSKVAGGSGDAPGAKP